MKLKYDEHMNEMNMNNRKFYLQLVTWAYLSAGNGYRIVKMRSANGSATNSGYAISMWRISSSLTPVVSKDLERRYSHNRSVISPNSVGFGADYVKVVEDTPILSAAEM